MSAHEPSSWSRRAFLRELAVVGASASALACFTRAGTAGSASSLSAASPLALDHIGVQLYTVGDLMRQDFVGTVEQVAAIGYKQVEFAGYFNKQPAEVRVLLDRLGLKSPSTHIGMDVLRRDLPAQIDIAKIIGHEYITIPSLGRSEVPMNTADAWKRVASECNEIGSKVKAAGLKLAFHSHSGEFIDVGGGKTGMDIFISETDPSVFNFQIDLGWARVASQDPVAWFRRYPGRFRMWHIKDFENLSAAQARQTDAFRNPGAASGGRGTGAPPALQAGRPAPIGAGDIDFKPILAAWKDAGLEYFFVEQDGAAQWPGGSLASIATSYQAVRKLVVA
ncbi:MAG: sugar phosphate isomerase/epimerase [bacterium]